MNYSKFKEYLIVAIALLKELARKAKKNLENQKEEFNDCSKGIVMGYYSIITLLKHQAFAFCMDQKELGLADIKPDEDLLGLSANPSVDLGEDNWAIDGMNDEKIKGYLIDTITLLKEQEREIRRDEDNPRIDLDDYNKGQIMAYYSVFSLLKHQASAFNIDEKDFGLADIQLEADFFET